MASRDRLPTVSSSFFDLFPAEIILKILGYVSQYDLACELMNIGSRRIRSLCVDPTLWKIVRVDETAVITTRKIILRSGPAVKTLVLSSQDSSEKTCSLAVLALESSRSLTRLKCSHDVFASAAVMEAIGKEGSCSLRHIVMTQGFAYDDDINWDDLYDLVFSPSPVSSGPMLDSLTSNAIWLRNITSIDMSRVEEAESTEWVKAIADNCPRLKGIAMPKNVTRLRDPEFAYFLEKVGKTLKGLYLNYSLLNDNSIVRLRDCQVLVNLCFYDFNNFGLDAMNAIAELATKQLRHLRIDGINGITRHDFAAVFAGRTMARLVHLTLSNCTGLDDVSLHEISMSCKNLEKLCIHNCDPFGDRGVCSIIHNCERLTNLWLFNPRVTAKAFEGRKNNKLRRVKINRRADLVIEIAKMLPQTCRVTEFWK